MSFATSNGHPGVFEDTRPAVQDNNLLGKFELSGIVPAPHGVPRIAVAFNVDANGIFNVSVADKTTGQSNRITITNDKARLPKEEIGRMINEAEKYKPKGEAAAARITSKNGLESYAYNLRNSLTDEKLAGKFNLLDESELESAVNDAISWLDA
ncbi:hypothetical protein EVJ58_g8193 [Rhodofomes roseus]|uniref:Heat shock protein 70 n=1 Tax=Rhodofomes roseus TaxID=34475 RepID=A0A4Y9Y1S8_9APHY|nr:hypothetical protein EVJ58_g8193 [Rhodofomes roseus]